MLFLGQDRQDLGEGVCRSFSEDVVATLVNISQWNPQGDE
jgi:hypothetical protein